MKNSILHHLGYSSARISETRHKIFRRIGRSFAVFAGLTWGLSFSISSMAAVPVGTLEGADESSVYGWAWDSDNYNHIIPIEISVYPSDSSQVLKTVTIKGDHYQDKLQESIGDGYHGFLYSIDWSQFEEAQLRVTAYAVTETDRVFLGELTYNKETNTHTPVSDSLSTPSGESSAYAPQGTAVLETEGPASKESGQGFDGPGQGTAVLQAPPADSAEHQAPAADPAKKQAPPADSAEQDGQKASEPQKKDTPSPFPRSSQDPDDIWEVGPGVPPKPKGPKGESLGMFITTGYCNCVICSSGSNLTYSGTVPQPGHTISADMNLFPMGTRLMIDDVIYTVEDIGSSVTQNKIDIYYATHEEAANHGTQEKEVFAVIE